MIFFKRCVFSPFCYAERLHNLGGGGDDTEMLFSALRAKEVIRICDAAVLGCVSDVCIDVRCGRILALHLSAPLFSGRRSGRCIPWECVKCVGRTAVLVDVPAEDISKCK